MAPGDKSKKVRAAERAAQAEAAAAKAAEDASWENDKSTKELRAAAKMKSNDDKAKSKAELRALTQADEHQFSTMSNKQGPKKTTQAQVAKNAALMNAMMMAEGPKKSSKKSVKSEVVKQPDLLVPNQNRLRREISLREGKDVVEGSGIDAAIGALNSDDPSLATKNKKVAYHAFAEKMMPIIQDENPNLKRSQYEERIAKLWQKSSENPANQQ